MSLPRVSYPVGVWSILTGQGLMTAGFFMLFPLLAVHLTQNLGFDAFTVGLIFGMRILLQQGTAPLGGALADRIGYKPAMVAGYAIRTVGFLLFAVSDHLWVILGAVIITSLGGTLFDPSSRAALAYLTPERNRQSTYAASGTAMWTGQVVGPLVGALLIPISFTWVCVASAVAFLVAAVQAAFLLPKGMRGEITSLSMWGSISEALRDTDFARFTALLLGYFFLGVQITITVPILTDRVVGPEAIGPIFAIQAGLAIVLQVPLNRALGGRVYALDLIAGAMMIIALGFAGYALADSFAAIAAATAVVAVGQMLVMPLHSTVTARLSSGQRGAYFGVGSLAFAFGGGSGYVLGGVLIDVADWLVTPWLPWIAMAGVALGSGLGFVWLGRSARLRARLEQPTAASQTPVVKARAAL